MVSDVESPAFPGNPSEGETSRPPAVTSSRVLTESPTPESRAREGAARKLHNERSGSRHDARDPKDPVLQRNSGVPRSDLASHGSASASRSLPPDPELYYRPSDGDYVDSHRRPHPRRARTSRPEFIMRSQPISHHHSIRRQHTDPYPDVPPKPRSDSRSGVPTYMPRPRSRSPSFESEGRERSSIRVPHRRRVSSPPSSSSSPSRSRRYARDRSRSRSFFDPANFSYGGPSYRHPAPRHYASVAPVIIIPQSGPEPPYVSVDPFRINTPRRDSRSSSRFSPSHSSRSSRSPPSPHRHPSYSPGGRPSRNSTSSRVHDTGNSCLPFPVSFTARRPRILERLARFAVFLIVLFFRKIPQQVYLHILLRLPMLYFSRVTRLFEDANLSLPDIRRMAVATAEQWKDGSPGALLTTWLPDDAIVSPHLLNFRHSWEGFIDSLLREWKTQNVVSALMLSAILTMLQIDAAASNPIARTSALLSLISALMSLLFGSIYIIRFGTMRKMYKAASWAEEAQSENKSIWWNVWVLLAIPAVWLAWSILLFVTCIMAFAWQTGEARDAADIALSHHTALGLRIGVSAMLTVAVVYFFLVIKTFSHYGDYMDRQWASKVTAWAQDVAYARTMENYGVHRSRRSSSSRPTHAPIIIALGHPPTPGIVPGSPNIAPLARPPRSLSIDIIPPGLLPPSAPPPLEIHHSRRRESPQSVHRIPTPSQFRPFVPVHPPASPFGAVKVMDLLFKSSLVAERPQLLAVHDVFESEWTDFCTEVESAWNGASTSTFPSPFLDPQLPGIVGPQNFVAGVLHRWNHGFFFPRSAKVVLCKEYSALFPSSPTYSIYLMHVLRSVFDTLPEGLQKISVIQLPEDPQDARHALPVPFTAQTDAEATSQIGSGTTPIYAQFNRSTMNDLPPQSSDPAPPPIFSPSPIRPDNPRLVENIYDHEP